MRGTGVALVTPTATDAFDVLGGHGGRSARALELGAVGGLLALATAAPELASEVYDRGDRAGTRELHRELVEPNRTITTRFGVAGLTAAMRMRGRPAGHVRSPHRPVGPAAEPAG